MKKISENVFFLCLIGLVVVTVMLLPIISNEINLDTYHLKVADFKENSCIDILEDGHSIITTDWDSQISTEFDSIYIKNIELRLDKTIQKNWKLQVFYANENEIFSEEKSVSYNVAPNQKIIKIQIDENVGRLRVDFGDEAGNTFGIEDIIINPSSSKIWIIIIEGAGLFFVLLILVKLIKQIKQIKQIKKENISRFVAVIFSVITTFFITVSWLINITRGVNVFEKIFIKSGESYGVPITFTSLNFIFLFLPLCVIGYYLIKNSLRNIFLVMVSIVFYAVGEPVMVWLLALSVFANYVLGLLLAKDWQHKIIKTIFLVVMLVWNLGLLYYYKYYIFTLENINLITGKNLNLPNIIQPLGISFFTFRTISFCLDVYWKTVPVQYNFANVALYICFFPQVSMGPISKYNDFANQLNDRKFDIDLFLNGIKRIIVGWSKKLIIANNIGVIVDAIFSINDGDRTVCLAWIGILGYLIQLYYDFSGYSDIAIGTGQLFGFNTPENFNYPFLSKSVVEYWSRWHITLGTWLKNYLYTPIFRTCQDKNLSIGKCNIWALLGVWLFAGIWHGAGWNYICYGLYYFAFIVLERIIEDYRKKKRKRLKIKKQPETSFQKIQAHIYFFVVLIFGQLLFRCPSLSNFGGYFLSLFGLNGNAMWNSQTHFYFMQSVVLMSVGWIFAFPVVNKLDKRFDGPIISKVKFVLTPVIYLVLLIVAIAFAMTDTYQSFIYFQF